MPSHGHAEPSARRRTTYLQEILTLECRGMPDASTAMRKGEGLQVAGPVALAGSEEGEVEGVKECVQHNEHNISWSDLFKANFRVWRRVAFNSVFVILFVRVGLSSCRGEFIRQGLRSRPYVGWQTFGLLGE